MNIHTKSYLPKINKIVTKHYCNKKAKDCGFVQSSSSRIKGYGFVKTMILANASDTLFTLNERCKVFNPNSEMSRSGLLQRINTA